MLIENFNRTIDSWIKALEHYNFTQLCTKPSANSWSLGQVYIHLIEDTKYYIEQIKICITTNDHVNEEASINARKMLLDNDFPDAILEGNPANAYVPQPASKEQLVSSLAGIKNEMNNLYRMALKSPFNGKTKHPGLNYFSAGEWLQFADMHFRHHLRQKRRIDHFLKMIN